MGWGHMGYWPLKNKVAYKGKLMQVNRGIMYTHCKLAKSFSRILQVSLSQVLSQYTCGCARNKNQGHRRLLGLLARIIRNWDENKTPKQRNGESVHKNQIMVHTRWGCAVILSWWVSWRTMWRACSMSEFKDHKGNTKTSRWGFCP